MTDYTSYFRVTAFLKSLADLIKCGSLSSHLMNVSVGDVEVKAGLSSEEERKASHLKNFRV